MDGIDKPRITSDEPEHEGAVVELRLVGKLGVVRFTSAATHPHVARSAGP